MENLKRKISILMVLIMSLTFSFSSIANATMLEADNESNGIITVDNLVEEKPVKFRTIKQVEVRETNDLSSEVIEIIPKETSLVVLEVLENDFMKIEYKEEIGFIHINRLVDLVELTEDEEQEEAEDTIEDKSIQAEENNIGQVDTSKKEQLIEVENNIEKETKTEDTIQKEIEQDKTTEDNKNISNYSIKVSRPNGMKYRTIKTLELKDGNSNAYATITVMAKGSYVKHLGTTTNDWFKLEYNGTVGYAHRSDVTAPANYDKNYAIEVSKPNGKEYRTIKDLHLRDGNSNSYNSLTIMDKGSYVKHLGTTDNDWFKLEYNGTVGYVHRSDVTAPANYDKNYKEIEVSKPNGREYRTIKDLHLREGNSDSYKSITLMVKGSYVKHLGTTDNDWFKLDHNGIVGYVHRSDVTAPANYDKNYKEDYKGMECETISSLNMRKGPSVGYSIIITIPQGGEVTVISTNSNGWSTIAYDGIKGYVNARYLKSSKTEISRSDKVEISPQSTSAERQRLVDVSLSLINRVPYFWGGKSYTTGWNTEWNRLKKVTISGTSDFGKYIPFGLDCSGFVDWAYRSAGLGRVFSSGGTAHQWVNSYSISQENALPGDVVFKNSPGSGGINHIGIYVGDSQRGEALVIHSSYSRGGVVITTLANSGLKHFRRAKDTFNIR